MQKQAVHGPGNFLGAALVRGGAPNVAFFAKEHKFGSKSSLPALPSLTPGGHEMFHPS